MEREITLYDIKRENGDWFILRAYLQDGKLKLEGQDFTGLAENMFGSEEYECFYYFDLENTKKNCSSVEYRRSVKGFSRFFRRRNERSGVLCVLQRKRCSIFFFFVGLRRAIE